MSICMRILAGTIPVALVAAAGPAHAYANRSTGSLPVSLTVDNSCRLVTKPLVFGIVTGSPTIRATTTLVAQCTAGTPYSVGIDNGKNWDGRTRRMYGGQAQGKVWYADYKLYRDAAYSALWSTAAGERKTGVIPASGSETMTIYGEAVAKNIRANAYIDTVTVVFDF